MVDSHAHISKCRETPEEVLAQAASAGLTRILSVGLDEQSNREQIAIAEAFEPVYVAVGRHPNDADGYDEAAAADIEELAGHEKVVAIGETGLDFFRDTAGPENQRRAFRSQIAIANRPELPIVRSGDHRWLLEDLHCIDPACPCTDVRLVVFDLERAESGDGSSLAARSSSRCRRCSRSMPRSRTACCRMRRRCRAPRLCSTRSPAAPSS